MLHNIMLTQGLRLRRAAAEGDAQTVIEILYRSPLHTNIQFEQRTLVESKGAESGKNALHRVLEPMVDLYERLPRESVQAIYYMENGLTAADLSAAQSRMLKLYVIAQALLTCEPNLDITDNSERSARQLLSRLPEAISYPLSQARELSDFGEVIVNRHLSHK